MFFTLQTITKLHYRGLKPLRIKEERRMETRGENCTTTESTFITLVSYFLLNDLNLITLFDPMPVRFIIKDLDKSFQ